MSCGCSSAKRYTLILQNKFKENETTYSFDFHSDEIRHWVEGDSSKLYLTVNGEEAGKKFSYATLPEEGTIRFTTRIREEASAYKQVLDQVQIGQGIEVTAPSGDFQLRREDRPVVILSNGVGIAATRTLVKVYEKSQKDIPMMLQINVDREGAIFKDEMLTLAKNLDNFRTLYTKSRDAYYSLLDYEMQELMVKYGMMPLVYAVGSNAFVLGTLDHLKANGFEDEDFMIEEHVKSPIPCTCGAQETCGCGTIFDIPEHSAFFKIVKAS